MDLSTWSETYKKVNSEEVKEKMKNPSTYMKTMNLKETRVLFRKAASILHTVRLHWKNNKQFREEGYDCEDCLSLVPPVSHPDHQDYLLSSVCQGNRDLRQGRRVTTDERDQAHYLMEVIARRNARKEQKAKQSHLS